MRNKLPGKHTIIFRIVKLLPVSFWDKIFLSFPMLYKTRIINFESYCGSTAIKEILQNLDMTQNIEGNIIECGSARIGTSVIMANYLRSKKINKKIFACDSFGKGFVPEELENERKLGLCKDKDSDFTYNSFEYVSKKIKVLNLEKYIIPIQGFFKKTLPKLESRFCFGFIDCDLKDSVIFSADTVWRNLSNKGILVFDDYNAPGHKGVKLGVDSFIKEHEKEILEKGFRNKMFFIQKR